MDALTLRLYPSFTVQCNGLYSILCHNITNMYLSTGTNMTICINVITSGAHEPTQNHQPKHHSMRVSTARRHPSKYPPSHPGSLIVTGHCGPSSQWLVSQREDRRRAEATTARARSVALRSSRRPAKQTQFVSTITRICRAFQGWFESKSEAHLLMRLSDAEARLRSMTHPTGGASVDLHTRR